MGKTIRWGLACALAVCCSSAAAQGKEIWEEYGKRVTSSASVGAQGPDLFGDQVSMSNGALSFSVTDVSLAGNNALPVAFTRKFEVRNSVGPHLHNDFPMEDWEIDLPNISGIFAPEWITGASNAPYQRCSVTSAGAARPPYITFDSTLFQPKDYWQGHTLSLPTGGGELLLLPADQARPSTGGPYFWITADQTRLSCLPGIQNWSGGGEGFLATAADGTRYWFDWMGSTIEDALLSKTGKLLARARVALYPTRVEDRFGNRVDYTYVNSRGSPIRLTRILASDGRQIDIAYNTTHGAVSSVTTGARTWQYQYALAGSADHTLTAVIQPDGSRWGISFAGLLSANVDYAQVSGGELNFRSCTRQPIVNDPKIFYGTATHPSGAIGEFTVEITHQGRSNVPVVCDNVKFPGNDVTDDVAIFPIYHHAPSLTKKRITGPGMDPMEWNYAYNAPHSFYYPGNATAEFPVCTGNIDCSIPVCTSDDCAGSSTTKVTDSKGDWIRHTYGTSYRYNEGKLLSVEVGTGTSTVLRNTVNTYDLSQLDRAYPARWGISPRMNWEGFPSDFHRPQVSRTIHQDGASFASITNSFDYFARPLSVARSGPQNSRTDVTQYHDNLSKWVLGQVSQSSTNGMVTRETGYDPTTAVQVWSKDYGKLQHTLGYRADGTLATVRDGRDFTTTLSSWKRGIPQLIQHPDGSTQSAVVDDRGWMSSNTDENGFRTCYTYDSMGRTASVTYPSETQAGVCDTSAWSPTAQIFESIGASEFGISAGHWRQAVSTGNARKFTYFDALWRPLLTHEYDAADMIGTQRFQQNSYDLGGRLSFASNPGSTSSPATGVWTEYDALGRVTSVSQDSEHGPLITRTEYLPGLRTQVTNPRGFVTTTQYQAWDEPGYDLPVRVDAPESAATVIVRDVLGKPLEVTRGGSIP